MSDLIDFLADLFRMGEKNPNKETDIRPVNELLLKVRKEFWQ